MTQDSATRGVDETQDAVQPSDPKPNAPCLESTGPRPPANPFSLLEDETPRGGDGSRTDILARLSRVARAAESDAGLAGAMRTVTAAWLDPAAWQAGLGLTWDPEADDIAITALAVATREDVDAWRSAAADVGGRALATLLAPAEETVPATELPSRMAEVAAEQGTDRVDVFPIQADGRVLGAIALFRPEASAPSTEIRRAMGLSCDMLCQVASRTRARAAVAAAAKHVRRYAQDRPPGTPSPRMEARLDLLFRGAEPVLWEWDLDGDALHLSPRWKAMLGHGAQELTGQPTEWVDRIHPDDADRVELELLDHLEGRSPRFESDHRLLHRDGTYRWVRARGVAARDGAGKATRMAGSVTDISASRDLDDRSVRDLMYHRLTGFPTAVMLADRIEQAMRRRLRRPDRSFAVLAVTLDGLPEKAKQMGSETTEEVLLTAGRRMANAIRPGDTVAHLDDLGFGIVLDDVKSLADANRVAERIVGELSQAFPLGTEQLTLSPAIGLALSRTAYESPEEMVRDAGIALRRARREDETVQVFDAATKAYAQSMVELEGDLRKAIESRDLFLEYQPVVSLSDGRITGVEAFLRWKHPERGLIPPSEFLPVAEEAGLLQELGYWAMERACRQMRQWIDDFKLRFPPNMAINLSESQLFDEAFVPRALETIEASGLDPRLVRLDVSESTFMKDGPSAGRILRALAQRGVRIAVDDFGTGYSSLGYLHRYPIGALKIDRSFVSGVAGAKNQWDVARTIIELAKILELEVIAEGIENREQFLQLRALGCQQAQGYFFSGPASANKTARLIESGYPLESPSATS